MSQDAREIEEQSTRRRSQILGMAYADTSAPDKQLYQDFLSLDLIKSQRVIPLYVDDHNIKFGITNMTSQQNMDTLRNQFLDYSVSFALISDNGYNEYLKLYDPPKKIEYQDVNITADDQIGLYERLSATLDQVRSDDVLAYLVQQTYQLKGSDIHLECQDSEVRVRIRVDGVLHPIAGISYEKYRQVLSSIAVAANVSTGEPEAQTGHINQDYKLATGDQVTVNLRVETVPTVHGVDVVMRLFNFDQEYLKLDNLGLDPEKRAAVDDVISHPSGLVLVVGPTGSGKTTTLYSIINTLNTPERKIITLEDPVEYVLPGIVQIPVHGDQNKEGFADKLRAVLRLDPDVVMVGEIRDQDTAKTALQASLTGHLVLATYHASSAAAALTRMLDAIGTNPLFVSAIHLVMAQRLVRKLDDSTKQAYQPDEHIKNQIREIINSLPDNIQRPDLDNITLYSPGSSDDVPFGYKGQIALREQFKIGPAVQELLMNKTGNISTLILEQQAIKDGMVTMLQEGVLKALAGETTLEEVYRVVG
jgi:type II secretory ATPase GspE/PulE/Tfp pilus assembly ATPase PilB-like protein